MDFNSLIENDNLEEAILGLMNNSSKSRRVELQKLLSGLRSLEKQNRVGVLSNQEYNIERAKYRSAIIDVNSNIDFSGNQQSNSKSSSAGKFIILIVIVCSSMLFWILNSRGGINVSDSQVSNSVIGNENIVNLPRPKEIPSIENVKMNIWIRNNENESDWLNDESIEYPTFKDYDDNMRIKPALNFRRSELLTYKSKYKNGELFIYPSLKHLDRLNNGYPIYNLMDGADMEDPTGFPKYIPQFPELDIKVTNNSDETIYFNRAELIVDKSILDTRPFIYAYSEPMLSGEFMIQFVNVGYCEILNPSIQFNLYPAGYDDIQYNDFSHSAQLDNELKHSIIKDLELHGIYWQDNYRLIEGEEFAQILGPLRPRTSKGFHQRDVLAVGILSFRYKDGVEYKTKRIKFKSFVPLPVDGYGAPWGITGSYKSVLKSSGTNYSVTVPVSHYLKPSEVDRFTVDLSVDKSSLHTFKVRLYFEDDEFIESKKIRAEILKTKNWDWLLKKE